MKWKSTTLLALTFLASSQGFADCFAFLMLPMQKHMSCSGKVIWFLFWFGFFKLIFSVYYCQPDLTVSLEEPHEANS